jgi:peptidoglycan/xylan/chitin deacetylase (PgdA/CDA1 family)
MEKKTSHIETKGRKLAVILSTDTEFDPPPDDGSWWDRPTRGFLDGLPRFLEICDNFNAPATFFCEGKLVEQFPDIFRNLARSHEIGSHSYNHEWLGVRQPPRWIPCRNDLSVLSVNEKMKIIRKGINAIQVTIGIKPLSFKAPFNSVDHPQTLALLAKLGFGMDSSLPSYNNESFLHPLRPTISRHASETDLWEVGKLRLLEIPFSTRPRPMFLHPFDAREEVMDTVARGMKLAMASVDFQSRLDAMAGRSVTLMHVTSHPWEFSTMKPWGGDGKQNAERLVSYLNELTSYYDVTFFSVKGFSEKWKTEYYSNHSADTVNSTRVVR